MTEFEKELATLVNKHCGENASNTPDFILAGYLDACLLAFNTGVQQRETWYGRDSRPTEPGAEFGPEDDRPDLATDGPAQ